MVYMELVNTVVRHSGRDLSVHLQDSGSKADQFYSHLEQPEGGAWDLYGSHDREESRL